MNTGQIAAEAGRKLWNQRNTKDVTQFIEAFQAAIEKALEDAFTEHVWKFSDDWTDGAIRALNREVQQLRAAHASEQFDATKHHPSCTPNDQDLMWVCAQCGHNEPADASEPWMEHLRHLMFSNHGYKPEGCYGCSDIDSAMRKGFNVQPKGR